MIPSFKCFVLLVSVFHCFNCYSQSNNYYWYKSNGDKFPETDASANEMLLKYYRNDSLNYSWHSVFQDKRVYLDQGIDIVFFKLFTVQPLMISSNKKLSPLTINTFLKRFSLKSYLNSQTFLEHLEEFTSKKILKKSYINKTLGQPTHISSETDIGNEKWTYQQLMLELYFDDSTAISFKSKNYAAHITKVEDKVDKIVFLEVPSDEYFTLTKVVDNGKIHYTLELYSSEKVYSKTSPVKLLFKNGRVITKDVEAVTNEDSKDSKTFARLYLNQQEALLLSTSLMTDFKLGDAHEVLPLENAEKLQAYFKVLLNSK